MMLSISTLCVFRIQFGRTVKQFTTDGNVQPILYILTVVAVNPLEIPRYSGLSRVVFGKF